MTESSHNDDPHGNSGRLPFMTLYTSDLLSSCSAMTCAEFGAYMRLLCQIWDSGPLTSDPERLRRMAGADTGEWPSLWEAISGRFTITASGGITQRRLEDERTKAVAVIERRRAGGRATAHKRWGSSPGNSPDSSATSSANSSAVASTSTSTSTSTTTTKARTGEDPEGQLRASRSRPERTPKPPEPFPSLELTIPAVFDLSPAPDPMPDPMPDPAPAPAPAPVAVRLNGSGFGYVRGRYPKRAGAQRWPEAERAYNARLAEGHSHDEIIAGVARYDAYLKAVGKLGTEYVMQAATFLGPNKSFTEDWNPPPSKADTRLASNLDAAAEFMRRTNR